MRNLWLGLGVITLLGGCGGGGFGGGIQVTGRVLSVSTGNPPNPQATVQIANVTAQTGAGDGVFVMNVPSGSSSAIVLSSFPTFTFTFPPVVAPTDLGDFWIGPATVTIVGQVIDAADSTPVSGVLVRFAGKRTTTDSGGNFTLTEVAYDPVNTFVFTGIPGRLDKAGYVPAEFFVNQDPIGGVINLPPLLIARISDPNPPPPPYNLWGVVSLQGGGSPAGTVSTLLQNGTPVRQFNVGNDGRYLFWAVPGDYTIRFEKTGFQTLEIQITGFTRPDQVIRNDVTLVP